MQESTVLLNIINELHENASLVDIQELSEATNALNIATKIFITGCGRTGLAMRALSNRLVHLGKSVYIVEDITTPAIKPGDLLVVGSGSGETKSLIAITKEAKKIGAKILVITIHANSTIGSLGDYKIILPGSTPKSKLDNNTSKSIQPMGSLFEQMVWLVSDALIMKLMYLSQISEEQMYLKHANLE